MFRERHFQKRQPREEQGCARSQTARREPCVARVRRGPPARSPAACMSPSPLPPPDRNAPKPGIDTGQVLRFARDFPETVGMTGDSPIVEKPVSE